MTRRKFLQLSGGIGAVVASALVYSRVVEPNWVQIEEVTLTIPSLPDSLAGKRVAQLSDIHLGTYFPQSRLVEAIQQVNLLHPDWLIVTGDYVTVTRDERHLLLQKIEELVEPLRLSTVPVFASLGNHDLWSRQTRALIQALNDGGATVLRNSNAQIAEGLWLAGIDDAWGGNPDLRAAMADIPASATTLLLAHEPDFIDQVTRQNAPVAAQFSGHSHGGQIRVPLPVAGEDGLYSYAPVVPHMSERYPIGLRRIGERFVYTSRGLGMWPVPFRFNCPPEITVFTLRNSV